jgi:transketolase
VPVVRVGTQDCFGRSGKVAPLLEYYGLTAQGICDAVKRAISKK